MNIAREVFKKVARRWKQYWCSHDGWRPAETSLGPARWCEDCDVIERITAEEMYAYFRVCPKVIAGDPAKESQ